MKIIMKKIIEVNRFFPCCFLLILCSTISLPTFAVPLDKTDLKKKEGQTKIRYKNPQEMDFEELLIQGKLKRPNLSVITGSVESNDAGLLRLRKDFLDRVSIDFGEEAK